MACTIDRRIEAPPNPRMLIFAVTLGSIVGWRYRTMFGQPR
jgi:hypothetical protein